MTDHTDLIARLRKDDLFWEAPITCRSEAADALQAAQAEIEAQQHRIQALWMERDAALARIAKLEPKRNVSPPSEELVLHKMRYHFWEADDDGPADFELFDAGVECDTCIDVSLVRQDRLDELIAAAGASPLTDTAAIDAGCRYITPLLTQGASPVQPSQDLQSVADALTIEQLNDKVERLMAAQPSQADAQDAARYRWLRPALTRGGNVEDSGELVAAFSHLTHTPTEPEFDAAIDAAINAKESGK